jgi:ceramide glucosyltransferase
LFSSAYCFSRIDAEENRPLTFLWLFFLPAIAYQILSLIASFRQFFRPPPHGDYFPPISVLKPVHGIDPGMHEAFASHAFQDYPDFEILFGVQDDSDPAIPVIQQLRQEFPNVTIRLIVGSLPAANGKVGVLANLARHAANPVWVVNDSDICVTPEYLWDVVAPLRNLGVGVVTCLYRPEPYSAAAAWEAFGIAVDFMPSTLVAPLVGVREFGLGSTLAFHADDFRAVGGFEALSDYLADDYQLAKRITALHKFPYLSTYIVETSLGDKDWMGAWRHQLRWGRTIRASKGAGYLGLPITHTGLWIVLASFVHLWPLVGVLLALRIAAALACGWLVLRLRPPAAWACLAPVWDLYAFAIWVASYLSNKVRWRDHRIEIASDGRIISKLQA